MKDIENLLKSASDVERKIPAKVESKILHALSNIDNQKKIINIKDMFCYFNKNDYIKFCITSLASVAIIIMATGVYATVVTYNNKKEIEQKQTSRNQNTNTENYYEWDKDMIYDDDMFYKKITEYSEYLRIKEKWTDIVDMTQADFQNEFIIILMTRKNTYISDVYCDENTTFIEISRDSNDKSDKEDKSLISTRISNDLLREKIDLKINPDIDGMKGTKKLKDITSKYSKEEAISDGCFVISNLEIISNNKEQLDDFIKHTSNNNEESSIRIVKYYEENYIFVCDIVYKNGIYELCNYNPETFETYFSRGNGIKKTKNENWNYWLVDKEEYEKYGASKSIICEIMDE